MKINFWYVIIVCLLLIIIANQWSQKDVGRYQYYSEGVFDTKTSTMYTLENEPINIIRKIKEQRSDLDKP